MEKELPTEILNEVIQPRKANTHKGNYGKIVCIGGNEVYGGAIILSAKAAVYSGAGLVTVVTHPQNRSALHAQLPEAMIINWQNKEDVVDAIQQADVITIGPGLGLKLESRDLLDLTFSTLAEDQTCIVDGSAITLIANNPSLFSVDRLRSLKLVFTPHQEEWHRLSGLSISAQQTSNNKKMQKHFDQTIILKKPYTEIYLNHQEVWKNTQGTPAMATGGMGDTLTGILASFLGQFPQKKDQAILAAVFLHSYLAEKLASDHYVVLPTHLIEALPIEMNKWA